MAVDLDSHYGGVGKLDTPILESRSCIECVHIGQASDGNSLDFPDSLSILRHGFEYSDRPMTAKRFASPLL